MTPIEETIQRFMEPDKHGEKGEPVRRAFTDIFGHPVQRTLDALWKFAEGTALAAQDNKDHYDSAVARIAELEAVALNALYHHQGSNSPVGQPIRKVLGIGRFDRLTEDQVKIAQDVSGMGHESE